MHVLFLANQDMNAKSKRQTQNQRDKYNNTKHIPNQTQNQTLQMLTLAHLP